MTTPKSHRPWFRDLIDRIDNYIAGPDDEPTTPFLPPDDTPTLLWPTVWQEGGEPLPEKVSPNVDHTPPPPIVTHPECATLTDGWAQVQAEADATRAWADQFRHRWDTRHDAHAFADAEHRLNRIVGDYHHEAARIVGAA